MKIPATLVSTYERISPETINKFRLSDSNREINPLNLRTSPMRGESAKHVGSNALICSEEASEKPGKKKKQMSFLGFEFYLLFLIVIFVFCFCTGK